MDSSSIANKYDFKYNEADVKTGETEEMPKLCNEKLKSKDGKPSSILGINKILLAAFQAHNANVEMALKNENLHNEENNITSQSRSSHFCPMCQEEFSSRLEMFHHLQTVHQDKKPFQCEVCSAKFPYRSSLYNHVRIHSAFRPFKCDWCDATFRWKNSLQHHKRHVHKNEGNSSKISFARAAKKHFGTTSLDKIDLIQFPKASNHSLRRLENFGQKNLYPSSGRVRIEKKLIKQQEQAFASDLANKIDNNNYIFTSPASGFDFPSCEEVYGTVGKQDQNISPLSFDTEPTMLSLSGGRSSTTQSERSNASNTVTSTSGSFMKEAESENLEEAVADRKKRKKQLVESIVKKLSNSNRLIQMEKEAPFDNMVNSITSLQKFVKKPKVACDKPNAEKANHKKKSLFQYLQEGLEVCQHECGVKLRALELEFCEYKKNASFTILELQAQVSQLQKIEID